MKKTFLSVVMAMLLLAAGTGSMFAAPAAAAQQLLLKGSLQAVENDVVELPTILVNGNGSGNATVLGRYSVHFEGIVHNDANGVGTALIDAQFVAANGDVLVAEASGLGTSTNTPGVNHIVEKYTIMGGTGRFAAATGNFTVERWLALATGVSTGTIAGEIIAHQGQ
jgi:hypothetical protein